MSEEEILRKIAYQQFLHDQLSTELQELDDLLRAAGFPRGITSVKDVAYEMLKNDQGETPQSEQ
jgi:hypothetical protein